MKQRSTPGVTVGWILDPSMPPDLVPMGDGVRLYSATTRTIVFAEACFFAELVASDDTPQPPVPVPTPQPGPGP